MQAHFYVAQIDAPERWSRYSLVACGAKSVVLDDDVRCGFKNASLEDTKMSNKSGC